MAPNLTVGTSVFLLEERIKEDKSAVPLINGSTILRGGKFKVQEKEQPETDYKPPTTGIEGYLQFKTKLIWLNIISIFAIHFLWIYCFATVFFRVKFLTFIFRECRTKRQYLNNSDIQFNARACVGRNQPVEFKTAEL